MAAPCRVQDILSVPWKPAEHNYLFPVGVGVEVLKLVVVIPVLANSTVEQLLRQSMTLHNHFQRCSVKMTATK